MEKIQPNPFPIPNYLATGSPSAMQFYLFWALRPSFHTEHPLKRPTEDRGVSKISAPWPRHQGFTPQSSLVSSSVLRLVQIWVKPRFPPIEGLVCVPWAATRGELTDMGQQEEVWAGVRAQSCQEFCLL